MAPPPTAKGDGNAKGDGKRLKGKGGKQGAKGSTLAIADATPKIASKGRDGKQLCRFFNTGGCTNPSCWFEHGCDVILPNGKACGGKHTRKEHAGPFMQA